MLSDEASALPFMNLLNPKEQEQEQKGEEESNMESRKFCADCKTSKTPLWRGGPSGPKSLCNACGIRYRKKKRMVSMEPTNRTRSPDKKRDREISHSRDSTSSSASATASTASKCWSDSLRMSLVLLGKDLLLQSSNVGKKQRWQRKRKLGEEELAAVSLMALSCGSVFA